MVRFGQVSVNHSAINYPSPRVGIAGGALWTYISNVTFGTSTAVLCTGMPLCVSVILVGRCIGYIPCIIFISYMHQSGPTEREGLLFPSL